MGCSGSCEAPQTLTELDVLNELRRRIYNAGPLEVESYTSAYSMLITARSKIDLNTQRDEAMGESVSKLSAVSDELISAIMGVRDSDLDS